MSLEGAPTYDFRGKYEGRNPIAQRLVEGFFRELEGLVAPRRPRRVLEVGCGEGYSTARLRSIVPEAHLEASDLETTLVGAARARNPEIEIHTESIYRLDRPAASFDMVVCLEVLEHLDDPLAALRELVRVSGAFVVLSVPREPLWRLLNLARGSYLRDLGNTPGHVQHWSTRGFVEWVGRVATVVEVRRPVPWTQVVARVRGTAAAPVP